MIINNLDTKAKDAIAASFSRASASYDSFSNVQKKTAQHIINMLMQHKISAPGILEIGCATGEFTLKLAGLFPSSCITAIDISSEMVKLAGQKLKDYPQIKCICCDAEVFAAQNNARFNLVVSNATFQWFERIEQAISLLQKHLTQYGWLIFSCFGPNTLLELDTAMKKIFGLNQSIRAQQFEPLEKIRYFLEKIFSQVIYEHIIYEERFGSAIELLKQLKYTGVAVKNHDKPALFTKKKLQQLDQAIKQGNNLSVSYETGFFACHL